MKTPRVAVVGGGITGLAAAHGLRLWAQSVGAEVTLFEASHRLGGVIRSLDLGGVRVEGGPDSLITRKPAAIELARSLGLGPQLIGLNPAVHGAYIYHRGRLHPIPDGLMAGVPTTVEGLWNSRLLSWKGKLRALGDLVLPSPYAANDMALGRLLRQRMGHQVVDRIAAPILSGIYAGDIDKLSLEATAPHIATLARQNKGLMRAARAARRPAEAPEKSLFMTLENGMETLVLALIRSLASVSIRTDCPVRDIAPADHGRYWVNTGETSLELYDAVILATPAWATAQLLKMSPSLSQQLEKIPYTNLAIVIGVYHPTDISHPMDKTGVLVPVGEDVSMTAATWVRSKWAYRHPLPLVPIRGFYGRAAEPVDLQWSDQKFVAMFRRDLQRTMGLEANPVAYRVMRIPHGMPQYLVGHRSRVRDIYERLKAWPGIYVAGAAYDGVGIPDCIHQGSRAAETLINEWEQNQRPT